MRTPSMIIAAAASLAVALPLACQTGDTTATADRARTWARGAVHTRIGSAQFGRGALNDLLAAQSRPTFSNTVATIGVGSYARRGRWLVGASVETAIPERHADGGWVTRLSGGIATLDAGIAAIDRPQAMLSVTLGLGARQSRLRLERQADFEFRDGLADPGRGVELNSVGGVAQLGIQWEWRLALRSGRRFAVGAQGGVLQPIGAPATSAGESRVEGAPGQSAGGFLRVGVGTPIKGGRDAFAALGSLLLWGIGR